MADFTIGDYEYTIMNTNEVKMVAIDKTKTSYQNISSIVTYNNVSYTVTSMISCFNSCTNLIAAPTIPDSVTNMAYCFYGCTSLTVAPVIPNSVTTMFGCFGNCTNLIFVSNISTSADNLGECFSNCTSLETIPVIPSAAYSLGRCFYGCTSLTGDIFALNYPAGSDIFTNTTEPLTIHVGNADYLSQWQMVADQYSNVTAIYDPSLTHLGDKISLKSLLSKITTQLKNLVLHQHSMDWCMLNWAGPTALTGYNTDYNISQFGGGTPSYLKSDSLTFTPTNYGIKVNKTGNYFMHIQGHINTSGGGYIRTAIAKYVGSALTILSSRWADDYTITSTSSWIAFDNSFIASLNAGDEIRPIFTRQQPQNTSESFRPSVGYLYVIYLGP